MTAGLAKGDGAFMPSCYVHTEDFCIRGGPRINHNGNDIKLSEILGKWFNEGDPAKVSCSLPMNIYFLTFLTQVFDYLNHTPRKAEIVYFFS